MGILDWECVSALPLWKACYYPQFLQGHNRRIIPLSNMYEAHDSESYNELVGYSHDLLEWEQTILRQIFIAEMNELAPDWVEVFSRSQLQRDFDAALQYADCWFAKEPIGTWLGEVLGGNLNPQSLREQLGR